MSLAINLGLALAGVTLLWFFGTGVVAWAGNRARATFGRSLMVAGLAGIWGLGLAVLAGRSDSVLAAYGGLAAALAIWGWHELSFLSGAVTGPRRTPCPAGLRGLARFRAAAETMIHHELALAVTLALLVSLLWSAPNPVAAQAFGLLFLLRLSTKLALFCGAPNFSDDLLPAQLGHLKSYFGPRRWHIVPVVLAATSVALAGWLAARFLNTPPGSGQQAAAGLLFALAALGALEHLFLLMPLKDAALWRWALPQPADMQHMRGEITDGL